MTERRWRTSTDPQVLLRFLFRRTWDHRKLRLFSCGCCRRVWPLLQEPRLRHGVEVGELFSDGRNSPEELQAAHADVLGLTRQAKAAELSAILAVLFATSRIALDRSVLGAASNAAEAVALAFPKAERARAEEVERGHQAELLRHIVGNPFQLLPGLHVPAIVRALAEAVDAQNRFALDPLHDSLLDHGLLDLAEHFRQPEHPRGCWVLDHLRGVEVERR